MRYTAAQLMLVETDWEMRKAARQPQGNVDKFKALQARIRSGDQSAVTIAQALAALGHPNARFLFPDVAPGNPVENIETLLGYLSDEQIARFALDCAWWASDAFWSIWPRADEEEEEQQEEEEIDPDAPLWHNLMFPQEQQEEEEGEEPDWNDPAVGFTHLLQALDDKNYREVFELTETISNNIHTTHGHDPWYGTTGELPENDVDHFALYACAWAARAADNLGGGTTNYYQGYEHIVRPKREEVIEGATRAAHYASEAKQDSQWVVNRLFKELGF